MTARVLVVDDIEDNIKVLKTKLEAEYYEIITASNGLECLEVAKEKKPDIILLDVMMPLMDGFETCQEIRKDPKISDIPVVMVTALHGRADRIKGLESGADDFLTKPVEDAPLFSRIRSLTRLKAMIDQLKIRGNLELGQHSIYNKKMDDIKDSNILIIDDDDIQIKQIIDKLAITQANTNSICEPLSVIQGEEDISSYDLIIVSTQLFDEDIDPLRLISSIRTNPDARGSSILAIVEEGDSEIVSKAVEIGINDYINSPVDVNELIARVRTLIRRKNYQDALKNNVSESVNLAIRDPLTNMYNRRFLDNYMKKALEQVENTKKPLSILALDLDSFKQVNDREDLGHDVGDQVLKLFANIITNSIRPSDVAVRQGGDEFLVILPNTSMENAYKVAQRIRLFIEQNGFELPEPIGTLFVTTSIGVFCVTDFENESSQALIKKADEQLYKAKQIGKNTVFPKI